MTNQTISLEDIAKRTIKIRQIVRDDIQPGEKREIEEYNRTNKEGFFFWTKKRKEYEKGLRAIQEKYQNDPLIQEWARLQEQCPHDYGPEKEVGGGVCRIRICSACDHIECLEQVYMPNYQDL